MTSTLDDEAKRALFGHLVRALKRHREREALQVTTLPARAVVSDDDETPLLAVYREGARVAMIALDVPGAIDLAGKLLAAAQRLLQQQSEIVETGIAAHRIVSRQVDATREKAGRRRLDCRGVPRRLAE